MFKNTVFSNLLVRIKASLLNVDINHEKWNYSMWRWENGGEHWFWIFLRESRPKFFLKIPLGHGYWWPCLWWDRFWAIFLVIVQVQSINYYSRQALTKMKQFSQSRMWLNYALHSKHFLFCQFPLLLESHLQEDRFLVIIWDAAEFYTRMRLSTWGIGKTFWSQTPKKKLFIYERSRIWFSNLKFIPIYLSIGTIPRFWKWISCIYLKAWGPILTLQDFLFLIQMTRALD